ncbi:transcription antitermination factor NusB [Persicimonas caeni]|uniref:Transcription antitermination protein NusB n=1 Tax=Persicimonas caeni TaxID=2292766 RepID=A0A4Y6PZU9_PERCE|nr:transcription antitermination factor NusB [Persicimonas caeni]QDG53770.1 transcription antitermination factor NusB [Persicimonas caeni]QED34991.1 transcription antitermination factor NusB [Persicimonas caeni]
MSVQQKKAREAALWALYGMDVTGQLVPKAAEGFYPISSDLDDELTEVWHDVEARVHGVVEELPRIDDEVQRVSPRWRLERMAVIDRNILRLGAWELFNRQTPAIVVINACVELAKEYGEQNTPGFVNGLLDQICKDHGIQISSE